MFKSGHSVPRLLALRMRQPAVRVVRSQVVKIRRSGRRIRVMCRPAIVSARAGQGRMKRKRRPGMATSRASWDGGAVNIHAWILLLPFGPPILEPNLHLSLR